MPSGAPSDRSQKKASPPTHDDGTVSGNRAGDASIPDPVTTPASQPLALLSLLRPPQADGELGRLGGFRIVRVLGQGGMGAVFEAHDPVVRRKVALKVMKPEMTARPESYHRFLREARSAAAVDHDHIIPVYQVGQDKGVLFIAMPLLKGESLHQRLQREPRLPIAAILKLGRETAEGLAAAHACDLIHRDIKPGNLWLEGTDECGDFRRVKILDFGLARAVHEDTQLTAAGGVLGTPAYMAPEQAAGEEVDHRADLFSLGAVLYRCCTGELPFKGPNTMAVLSVLANKTPVPVREKNPDVPVALADLINRLLAKTPGDRPQTAAEVATELRRIEQECMEQPVAVRRPHSRLAMACVAAILALGLIAAAGVIVVKVHGPDNKESEVTAPEGSKIAVDPKGNVVVTLPPDAPKQAPNAPAKQADPVELECRLKAEGRVRVRGLVLTPDGKRVIAGYGNGLAVWELASRKISKSYDTGSGVHSLALHPDGRTVAVVSGDGSLFTWDSETGAVVRHFTGHSVFSGGIAFARNGKSLVTPDSKSKTIVCWDTATGKHQVLCPYLDDLTYGGIQATPDGDRVAIKASTSTPVRIVDLSSGQSTWISRWPANGPAPVFTSDGKKIIFAIDHAIVVWDLKSRNPSIGYGVNGCWGLAISQGDRFLAAAGATSREVLLWDLNGTGKPIREWTDLSPGGVTRVAFTPSARHLLSGHEDGTICVLKVPQNPPVWQGFAALDPGWLARTTKLAADEQVKEVTAELKRRNPGFNDPLQVVAKDDQGQVREVTVETTELEDLSPFCGIPALRGLMVCGRDDKYGRVWNLSCLKGMNLLYLGLHHNRVWDLSPLHGIPLNAIGLSCNPVYDLSPLQNMKLQDLGLNITNVDDISPLQGMPLEVAWLHWTRIKDLSPLSKAPLKSIAVGPAADLEPLQSLPLELVQLLGDYKPQQIKMLLRIPTLKQMHLGDGKYTPEQLKEFRGNPILKTINGKPAAEFWKAAEKPMPLKKGETPGNG